MKSFASIARASATALACSAVALLTASSARADILPLTDPTIADSGHGTFYWTYPVFVTQAQNVKTGDFFTIYDFGGLVSGTEIAPAGWSASESLLNTPVFAALGSVIPNDLADVFNVTFTYSGTTIVGGPTNLGDFVLETTLDLPPAVVAFVGRGTDRRRNLTNANLTNTLSPTTDVRPPDIPEPGAYVFAVLAAGSLIGLMARKRKA